MSLTYDQRSELRLAFEQAYVEPERRRACRIRHRVPARLTSWPPRSRAVSIDVTIEDFSTTGVGLIHGQALEVGEKYLIELPRRDRDSVWVLLTVARCAPMDDGTFAVGMETSEIVDHAQTVIDPPVESVAVSGSRAALFTRRTKILFLLFGIVGTAIASII